MGGILGQGPDPQLPRVPVDGITDASATGAAVLRGTALQARLALGLGAAALLAVGVNGGVAQHDTSPAAILTTRGDVIRRGASAPERLNAATTNTFLGGDGTDLAVRTAAQVRSSLNVAQAPGSFGAMWSDAAADWRFYGLARGTTSVVNTIAPGTYNLTVPSSGSYSAQDRLGVVDPGAIFDGGWMVVDTATAQSGGAVVPVSGAGASGDRLEPSGAFSVVVWAAPLYVNGSGFGRFALLKRRDDSTWGGGVFTSVEVGLGQPGDLRPYAQLRDGSSDRLVTATRALSPTRLVQIAVTLSGATGTATLYLDGVSQGTASVSTGITWGTATTRSWCIGANGSGGSPTWAQEWPGWIGRVGVWTRAVTAIELAADVVAVRGR